MEPGMTLNFAWSIPEEAGQGLVALVVLVRRGCLMPHTKMAYPRGRVGQFDVYFHRLRVKDDRQQEQAESHTAPLVDAQIHSVDGNAVVKVQTRQSHPNLIAED
jgi:hypothetical protein